MSSKKEKIIKRIKVRELVKVLMASEKFLEYSSYGNEGIIPFIRELRMLLKPYGGMDAEKFLEILRESFKDIKKATVPVKLDEFEIKHLPLSRLKTLVSNKSLSTKELLFIAEKRLGIPIGVLKGMRKEVIRSRILSTIQNIEKLDAIKKKASE